MGWGEADISDQSGKTIVVTGANSGIGWEAARMLAAHGARVLLGCRNPDKAADAVDRIRASAPDASLEVVGLDLADLSSVEAAAKDIRGRVGDRIDVLVNNAGVMATPYRTTADGFELQFGTNHLGHYALTGHLLDLVTAGDRGRVVTVSSQMHRMGRIDFDDLQHERRYNPWIAYGQAKLANLLFAFELQRRLAASGYTTLSVACHPGWATTHLQTAGPQMAGNRIMERASGVANRLLGQPAAGGALPTAYAATAADVGPGDYFGPGQLFEMRGAPKKVGGNRRARDEGAAARLWVESERLTGVKYGF